MPPFYITFILLFIKLFTLKNKKPRFLRIKAFLYAVDGT